MSRPLAQCGALRGAVAEAEVRLFKEPRTVTVTEGFILYTRNGTEAYVERPGFRKLCPTNISNVRLIVIHRFQSHDFVLFSGRLTKQKLRYCNFL